MIRYALIQNNVLILLNRLQKFTFPMQLDAVINSIPNCRYMSYQEFAAINKCSIADVVKMCESTSGCTHYNILQNKYLILYNASTRGNNNYGRQRWTLGHEIGHVVCRHLEQFACEKLCENSLKITSDEEKEKKLKLYEREADFFASILLAPFPLYKILDITSPIRVQKVFGLSTSASESRYEQYLAWLKTRRKTAWENDIIKLFKEKNNLIFSYSPTQTDKISYKLNHNEI